MAQSLINNKAVDPSAKINASSKGRGSGTNQTTATLSTNRYTHAQTTENEDSINRSGELGIALNQDEVIVQQLPDSGFGIFQFASMKPTKNAKIRVIAGQGTGGILDDETVKNILENQKKFEGLGYLSIEKVGIAGIPSLWMPSQQLIRDRYISRQQILLLEKYHKICVILKCHRKWEQEKMWGKNSHLMSLAGQTPVEYQFFTGNRLSSKFSDKSISTVSMEDYTDQVPLLREYAKSFYTYPNTNYSDTDNPQYKLVNSDNKTIKKVLEHNNMQLGPEETNAWQLLWSCMGMGSKPHIYEGLLETQKLNHFVNSTELTRKDKMTFNFQRMQQRFGSDAYSFIPESYVLPEQIIEFKAAFMTRQEDAQNNIWIVKPASSSRGRGIYLLRDLNEIPKGMSMDNDNVVVSRYINNPLLIKGFKFDIRIYVLVTGLDPLKMYVYNEGLVRFASEPYQMGVKGSKFSHLTNYSINKKNDSFVQNKSKEEQDYGNKWSMSALQKHLQKLGINVHLLWQRIYDCIIKSYISVEDALWNMMQKIQGKSSKSNCFELLGFDIMLDDKLNPWVLEVNLAPSLTADSPLDFHIKTNLAVDVFNVVGIRRPVKRGAQVKREKQEKSAGMNLKKPSSQGVAPTTFKTTQGKEKDANEGAKQAAFSKNNSQANFGNSNQRKASGFGGPVYEGVEIALLEKLSKISAKHRHYLIDLLGEFERNTKLNFTRIFPAPGCQHYDQFFDNIRPSNQLAYKYLCTKTELLQLIDQSAFNDLLYTTKQERFENRPFNFSEATEDDEEDSQSNLTPNNRKGLTAQKNTLLASSSLQQSEVSYQSPLRNGQDLSPIHVVEETETSSAPCIGSNTDVSRKESNDDKSHTFSNNSESDEVSFPLPANPKIDESPFEEISAKSDTEKSEQSSALRLTVQKVEMQMLEVQTKKSGKLESTKASCESPADLKPQLTAIKELPQKDQENTQSLLRVEQLKVPPIVVTKQAVEQPQTALVKTEPLTKDLSPKKDLTNSESFVKNTPKKALQSQSSSQPRKANQKPKLEVKALEASTFSNDVKRQDSAQSFVDEDKEQKKKPVLTSPTKLPKKKKLEMRKEVVKVNSQPTSDKTLKKETLIKLQEIKVAEAKVDVKSDIPKPRVADPSNTPAEPDKERNLNIIPLIPKAEVSSIQKEIAYEPKLTEKDDSTTIQTPIKILEQTRSEFSRATTEVKDSQKEESKEKHKKKKEKVVITGDDILIEYVRRIKHAVKKTREVVLRDTLLLQSGQLPDTFDFFSQMPKIIITYLDRFLNHKVWRNSRSSRSKEGYDESKQIRRQQEFQEADLYKQLKIRYIEMIQRRESVKKSDARKKAAEAATGDEDLIKLTEQEEIDRQKKIQKLRNDILGALSAKQVEQMVVQSNQRNPIEIVSILVATLELKEGDSDGKGPDPKPVKGLLSQIEEFNNSFAEKQHELRLPSKGSPERPRFKQVQSDVQRDAHKLNLGNGEISSNKERRAQDWAEQNNKNQNETSPNKIGRINQGNLLKTPQKLLMQSAQGNMLARTFVQGNLKSAPVANNAYENQSGYKNATGLGYNQGVKALQQALPFQQQVGAKGVLTLTSTSQTNMLNQLQMSGPTGQNQTAQSNGVLYRQLTVAQTQPPSQQSAGGIKRANFSPAVKNDGNPVQSQPFNQFVKLEDAALSLKQHNLRDKNQSLQYCHILQQPTETQSVLQEPQSSKRVHSSSTMLPNNLQPRGGSANSSAKPSLQSQTGTPFSTNPQLLDNKSNVIRSVQAQHLYGSGQKLAQQQYIMSGSDSVTPQPLVLPKISTTLNSSNNGNKSHEINQRGLQKR